MSTIPIKLKEVDLEKIDYLIKRGKYKNRSQAIMKILQEKLDQELLPFEFDSQEAEEQRKMVLKKMLAIEDFKVEFLTPKSAVELISEERERS
jgi:Arc/MetJ-type ribon-helix-helix transcriptional regulator